MNRRGLIWLAALGNIAVIAGCLILYGWNPVGAHLAARNTARFSSLWFAVGFAAPGLAVWFRRLPGFRIVHAFVATHTVHFAVVAALLVEFDSAHVLHNPVRSGLVIVGGSAIVLAAGLTAKPRPSAAYRVVHEILMSVLFLLFVLALLNDPFKPLRGLAALVALALVVRLIALFKSHTAPARAAG